MPRDDRDEYEIEDFGTRMSKQALTGNSSLELPEGLQLYKPKKSGSINLDIVPFVVTKNHLRFRAELRNAREGRLYPERTFHTHRNIGVNGEIFTCLAATFGERCPICEDRARLKMSAHKDDTERAYELKPKDRQMWLIWDNDDPDRGVQLWEIAIWNFGRHLMKYVEGARKEDRDAYKAFFHPTRGFNLRITATVVAIGAKEGKKGGDNTEYTVHQFYPRPHPLPRHIIDHGYDLDGMVRKFDYQALKDLYAGTADVDDVAPTDRPPARSDRDERPPARRDDPDIRPQGSSTDPAYADRHREADGRDDRPPARRDPRDDRDEAPPARTSRAAPLPPPRDEPDPADQPVNCATGDRVEFPYRGEVLEGEVLRIDVDRRLAYVEVEGATRPHTVPMEDITVLAADDRFDRKPEPAPEPEPVRTPVRRGKAAEPPPDDAPPARPRNSPAAETKAAKANKWDDDEPDTRSAPPARRAKAVDPEPPADDAPPPARKRR